MVRDAKVTVRIVQTPKPAYMYIAQGATVDRKQYPVAGMN